MKTMKNIAYTLFVVVSLFVSVEAIAQFNQQEMPVKSFQSTSTLAGSGSTYAANPTLNIDGSACVPYSSVSSASPSGPRRAPTPNDDDDDDLLPIGDGTWILMLLAIGYAFFIAWIRMVAKR